MEVGLKPLAVLGAKLTTHTTRAAHHGGNGEVAAAGVAEHSHVVRNLVEGQEQEAHVHTLNNRPEAGHRGTNRHSGEAVLSNWSVEHPEIAVFLRQILGDLVTTAVVTDVLPHHADVGVSPHLLVDGFPEGVEEKCSCHGVTVIPANPGGEAKLSQSAQGQPPAAKVNNNKTESSMAGDSSNASWPRSWGVIQTLAMSGR